jgi:hypothetical protein
LAEIYRNAAEVAKERGEEIKLEAIMWGKEAASSFSSTSMFDAPPLFSEFLNLDS